ncbi:MAG: alpha/beta fold hydrolase [Anaerolineales bacterium]|nr:alpha/beta fold hydrolase [Anaerolineales bacterium]
MEREMIFNPQFDGGEFFWQTSAGEAPARRIGILMIHGFTATVQEVRPLSERLHAQGYSVAAPLLPGHYTRPEDLNKVRWEDWVAAVEAMYQRLKAQCDIVIAGGESTGGLLAMYLASKHPEIAALLLYAPALRLTLRPQDHAKLLLLSPFIPWVPKKNMTDGGLWQGYPVNPLKGTLQLLELQKVTLPLLPDIHQPLLVVQGRLDLTVHPDVPDLIFSRVSSTIKEKHWMEKSAHTVILDKELDQVTQITLDFIRRTLEA